MTPPPTKSSTCFGTHGPLTVYYSRSEAQNAAARAKEHYGRDFEAYKCRACRRWHISPVNGKGNPCGCTDANDNPKTLYPSRDAAENAARAARRKTGASLYVYPCEHVDGWHLTANPY